MINFEVMILQRNRKLNFEKQDRAPLRYKRNKLIQYLLFVVYLNHYNNHDCLFETDTVKHNLIAPFIMFIQAFDQLIGLYLETVTTRTASTMKQTKQKSMYIKFHKIIKNSIYNILSLLTLLHSPILTAIRRSKVPLDLIIGTLRSDKG